MEPQELKAVIECLLFVSDKPLSLGTLQGLLEDVDRRTLLAALDELKADYDQGHRAFQLVEIAEGYQLATRVQYAPWIRKLYKSRASSKLSRAALETLAIVAYRQPITKAEIEDIRGVSADSVVNMLLERKLIRIVGRKEVVGRPMLYGTTKEFLHYFGLKDLNDMPMLKDLEDILKEDEASEDWELNPSGELVAKIKPGAESVAGEGESAGPTVETEGGAIPAAESAEPAQTAGITENLEPAEPVGSVAPSGPADVVADEEIAAAPETDAPGETESVDDQELEDVLVEIQEETGALEDEELTAALEPLLQSEPPEDPSVN
ncbi:MAG: SMC-Scp complex subunit ScpB [candidate division FCPU426 bacterium]